MELRFITSNTLHAWITFHVQHWCNFLAFLRFSKKKESHAIIMKVRLPSYTCVTCHVWQVDRERQLIVEDFRLEECDAEEVAGELPTHQPRFLVSRYNAN